LYYCIFVPRRPPSSPLFPYTTLFRSLFALRKASLANAAAAGRGKIVTVFSPKGGSGKTILATNIAVAAAQAGADALLVDLDLQLDRKSTRLNSSHRTISYAVFCLKKK